MNNVRPLDEDSLGSLEEDTRSLVELMKKQDHKVSCWYLTLFLCSYFVSYLFLSKQEIISRQGKVRKLLLSVTLRWPGLRATCTLGAFVDFTLIPRAMQAEEDLINVINEYKSLETIRSIRT
jgi:hypothetical protein